LQQKLLKVRLLARISSQESLEAMFVFVIVATSSAQLHMAILSRDKIMQ